MYVNKSRRVPFYIFRHYATFFERNFFQKFQFFSKKIVLRFLSLRYGADFRRSRLVIISAIAGILLKPQNLHFFPVKIFVVILKNSDILLAVSISVRFKFLKLPTTIRFSGDGMSEW